MHFQIIGATILGALSMSTSAAVAHPHSKASLDYEPAPSSIASMEKPITPRHVCRIVPVQLSTGFLTVNGCRRKSGGKHPEEKKEGGLVRGTASRQTGSADSPLGLGSAESNAIQKTGERLHDNER
ncbi:hypothetical protein EJ04DRAFT_526130 [Polyplosphaeria fusca]|uniref:Uncharacterized protein n=1 Tax=Polyplosphaeria fusca TaxID=682080 RepID=A0A9P4QUB3_9PLEO|nr:hypothetical protein EJ04DRAFT_526130 [Polyplosphaeria fusca]